VFKFFIFAEKPTAFGTLADLTCDSDGKIDRFITTGTEDTKSLLELHVPEPDKPYLLGMFLVGAWIYALPKNDTLDFHAQCIFCILIFSLTVFS
jgi:arginine decarboxylase-like protein